MKHVKLFEQFVNEAVKIKMNALDWGKSTAERNANLDKYDSLKTDKEREEFLRKLKGESVIEAADYTYKEDSGTGKPTWVLKLGPESWQKVKHLFDKEGRPTQELTRIPAAKSVWNLYASSYTSGGKEMHKIYGVSGDWTFGNAPTYYQQKHRGNKKAAKEVFDWFIKTYLD